MPASEKTRWVSNLSAVRFSRKHIYCLHTIPISSCLSLPRLRTPIPHRLEREARRHDGHDDIQARAEVDRDGRGGVGGAMVLNVSALKQEKDQKGE